MSDGGRPTLDEHKEKVAWNPAYALVMMGEPERRISTAHSSSLLLIPLCVRARTKKGDGERSSYTLFERFFAPRCASHLSHLDRAGKSTDERPLNDVCSMWWDIAPVCGCSQGLDRAELDAACLDVMRMTLDLDSDACWESALHGLGHCYCEYPTQVKAIIDRFLDRHPDLRAELRAYAWAARAGRVQ